MNSYIHKALLQISFVTATLFVASCGNNQNTDGADDNTTAQHEAILENNNLENDAQFLVTAAEMNLKEIQLGQLAQQNGNATHVKELGKMMEDAHTKTYKELATIAENKMVVIPIAPTEQAEEACNTLKEKSGNDFDKSFADLMVNGHKDAIASYEKASADGKDPDIKNWAAATLPALRTHLNHSLECQKKCNNM